MQGAGPSLWDMGETQHNASLSLAAAAALGKAADVSAFVHFIGIYEHWGSLLTSPSRARSCYTSRSPGSTGAAAHPGVTSVLWKESLAKEGREASAPRGV